MLLGDNKDAFEVAYEASGEKAIRVLNNAERSLRIAVEGLKEIATMRDLRQAEVVGDPGLVFMRIARRTLRELGEA